MIFVLALVLSINAAVLKTNPALLRLCCPKGSFAILDESSITGCTESGQWKISEFKIKSKDGIFLEDFQEDDEDCKDRTFVDHDEYHMVL